MEQRRAAHIAAARLKHQFKFDLAMYTARCEVSIILGDRPKNPTQLGDDVLWLVKIIVAQQGRFKYKTLAQLFLKQMDGVNFQAFKFGLLNYLTYSVDSQSFTQMVRSKLEVKLDEFKSDRQAQPMDSKLLQQTCEYLINCFTTEDGESPAALFHLFQLQGLHLTLVMLLLKLVLILTESRVYLEARLAQLLQYYSALQVDA